MAKYRAQLLEPDKKGPKGEGFEVMKSGGTFKLSFCFRDAPLLSIIHSLDRRTSMPDWVSIRRKVDPAIKDDENRVGHGGIRIYDSDSELLLPSTSSCKVASSCSRLFPAYSSMKAHVSSC